EAAPQRGTPTLRLRFVRPEHADEPPFRRAGAERPRRRGTTEKRDEFPPPHWLPLVGAPSHPALHHIAVPYPRLICEAPHKTGAKVVSTAPGPSDRDAGRVDTNLA